tara:strand:+ start:1090 stop:2034 length:945 start_codon:yes stop_codon:yes gene_type:complete
MFSERYQVIEKYSLTTYEHVSTIEGMPRRFTSLADDQYLPELNSIVKHKLNRFFSYENPTTNDSHMEHEKVLQIEHKDGEILSYFAIMPMPFVDESTYNSVWRGMCNYIECPELISLKERINNICNNDVDTEMRLWEGNDRPVAMHTGEEETYIGGLKYKPDGSFDSVRIYDPIFNLSEQKKKNDLVRRINLLPKCRGESVEAQLDFYADSSKLDYYLRFLYPLVETTEFMGKEGVVRAIDQRDEVANMYLEFLGRTGDDAINILSAEQVAFIREKCVGKSGFDLEYLFDEDGQLDEIYLHHHVVIGFEDLTTA